ncbi:MAG: carbohydrate-binding domain-containing protein [Eubacteriales bacterium]|nr:carbohydrate-binding domain-containing protein [Eubacteriales bacterium]
MFQSDNSLDNSGGDIFQSDNSSDDSSLDFQDNSELLLGDSSQSELDISKGNIEIDDNMISGFDKEGNEVNVPNSAGYVITGSTTTYTIKVKGGAHNITLNGVEIRVNKCAFQVDNATVNLTLAENTRNTLDSSSSVSYAGLQINTASMLTISGEGELIAAGSTNGAGIGGGSNGTGGTITIEGNARVTATGGTNSAGIGGGSNGSGGTVTIKGNATVTATGGFNGAGIGGGSNGDSGDILVAESAFVDATSRGCAAIGGGSNEGVQSIIFNGNVVVFTHSSGNRFIGPGGIAGPQGIVSKIQGVIFEGDKGTVYGTVSAPVSFIIPAGSTMTVPENSILNIPDGKSVTNNGNIENKGQIIGSGEIVNSGVINDYSGHVSVNLSGQGALNKSVVVDVTIKNSISNPITEAIYGDVITIHASIWDSVQNTEASAGTVVFKSGTNRLDTQSVSQGIAVSSQINLTGPMWKPGNYTIWAEYSGGTGLLSNTASQLLTIKKAERTISLSGSPSMNGTDVTLNTAVLSKGENDGRIQYGYSLTKDSQTVANWQASPVFTGLESGKTYYFFASVSEGTYYEKAVSSELEVTIPIYEGIWVNNVDLLQDADHTITCGNGTASFDPGTNVLTLKNARIDRHYESPISGVYTYPFIWLNTMTDCTIVLEGDNHIGVTGDSSRDAIMAQCNLTIKGPGSLTIESGGKNLIKEFIGIHTVNANIIIQDTSIIMKNHAADTQEGTNFFSGVFAQQTGKVIISNTMLDITDYNMGMGNGGASIEIKNDSKIFIRVKEPSFQPTFGIVGLDIAVRQSDLNYDLLGTEKNFTAIIGNSSVMLDGAHIDAVLGVDNEFNSINSLGKLTVKNGCDIDVRSCYPPLYGETGIDIEDSKIKAVSTIDSAVFTKGTLTISGKTEIEANAYKFCALQSHGDMTIKGGKIKALSTNDSAIYTKGRLEISGETEIEAEAQGFCALQSDGDMTIKDGRIQALSPNDSAIFTKSRLEIIGTPDIKANGFYRALQANGDMKVSGGKIEAISIDNIAIRSRGMLSITGGEIYAKGKTGYAAIAAQNVRTASEDAVLRINADMMVEKNGAWPTFSDWTYYEPNKETRSWSAFIPREAEKLEVQDGAMLNASTEVWLAAGCTVIFDVNGGTGTNTTVKVYPGNKVTPPSVSPARPGYYLAGWSAENGSDFDITSTPVSRDMTLYAKWAVASNVSYYTITASAGEHGTITPSGSISVREYTDQTFTFTPEEGYEAAEVLVDGKKVQTGDFYKFERVTAGHTISVSFLKKVPEDYPDGTVAKPDGSFVTPDGVVILPDGTVILNDKDKTELKPDSDGNVAVVNKDGTVTVQDGSVRNPDGTYVRPAKPKIKTVQVRGNRVDISLNERTAGAAGYDYVISPNPNCIKDKDYTRVNKNVLLTNTSMFYVQQDTYYAYCHSWLRGSDGKKVFSQWSKAYEFTVSDYTPEAPAVISTANPKKGVVVVTVSVPEGAKGFDVILGRSVKKVNGEKRPVDYGTDVQKNRNSTLKTVTFRNVKPGTVYAALHSYTRAKKTNIKVFSPWSASRKITVK